MHTTLKDKTGFSLFELILALLIGSLVLFGSFSLMNNYLSGYAFLANRKSALSDIRHAANRIASELMLLETSDISSISSTRLDFTDENGNATHYRLDTNGPDLAIFRGGNLLVDRVQSLEIAYMDGNGNALPTLPSSINSIRRIGVKIESEPLDQEGAIIIKKIITPRNFIGYENFTFE